METVMTNLRSMFPDVREPDSFVITRWGDVETIAGGVSEPDNRGKSRTRNTTDVFNSQYTAPMPGRDMEEDIEALSRSLGRLYWAGEATARAAWGSGEKRYLCYQNDLNLASPNHTVVAVGAWNTGGVQAREIVERLGRLEETVE